MVDCQSATVAWGPGGAGNIYTVAVKYKCDNDTQVNNYSWITHNLAPGPFLFFKEGEEPGGKAKLHMRYTCLEKIAGT